MSKNFTEKMKSKTAENPALMFISQPEPKPAPEAKTKALRKTPRKAEASPLQAERIVPADKPTPPRKEYKSRRLQLLIQPSLYEEIRDRAEAEGLSVNEKIHNLLRQALGE